MQVLKSLIRLILPEFLSHRLANWIRARRRTKFSPYVAEHSYCGESLKVHIGDPMAKCWYDRDWVDEFQEILMLKQFQLKSGATVFDIGAHQGVVALIFSRLVGQNGKVLAVEGDQWNARQATKNQETNQATNLRVINAAVGSVDQIPPKRQSSETSLVRQWSLDNVPFRSVDSLAAEYGLPNLVYVDVDGFELDVLAGASETLASDADWFVEVHVGCGLESNGGSWQDVLAVFFKESHELFIASEKHPKFVSFDARSDTLLERFFLVAIRRSNAPPVASAS